MGFAYLVLLSEGLQSIEDGCIGADSLKVVVDVFFGVNGVFLEDDGVFFEVELADLHTVALGCPGKDIFNEHGVPFLASLALDELGVIATVIPLHPCGIP